MSSYLEYSPTVDEEQDPDYVYMNCNIVNNNTSDPLSYDPTLRYMEIRDAPIIRDASKYNFSIVRFCMDGPGKDLPMFIPTIESNQPAGSVDVNKTVYKITLTMKKNGVSYTSTKNISYQPETTNPSLAPLPPNESLEVGGSGQVIGSRYYWVYTYSHWLKLVNATFQACLADLANQCGAAVITKAPFVYYNPNDKLFSLYADAYGFGGSDRLSAGLSGAANEELSIYFNTNMYGLFANFYSEFQGNQDLTYKVIIRNLNGMNLNTSSTPKPSAPPGMIAGYYVSVQDYSSTSSLWCPVESIVFTSNLLPLVNEAVGDPVRFNESNITVASNSKAAFQPIITDVALVNDAAHDYRGFIQYSPSAEYRLASFQRSKTAINQIDIQVYWKCRLNGEYYPVQMYNLSSVSIKMMFRRRGVYNFPHPAQKGYNV